MPDPAARALGRKGGKATAARRTPEERSKAARRAVSARWAKEKTGSGLQGPAPKKEKEADEK